jgi:hypothetical protein
VANGIAMIMEASRTRLERRILITPLLVI